MCGGEVLGWVVGESSPERSVVVFKTEAAGRVRAGSYIVGESIDGCVLGIVERLVAGSSLYPGNVSSPEVIDSLWQTVGGAEYYLRGHVRWLSRVEDLERGRIASPRYPAIPGSTVSSAGEDLLSKVFSPPGPGWVRLGELQPSGVEYRVNVNRLTRHLAILAVTGGGKSNTVCILARRLVEGLGATIVLFDMHGEYGDLGLGGRARIWSPASVNPASLSFRELMQLVRMPPQATNQERILRWAWRNALEFYRRGLVRGSEVLDTARRLVEALMGGSTREVRLGEDLRAPNPPQGVKPDQVQGVLNKLDDLHDYYSDALNPGTPLRLENIIEPGKLTVFDLSSLDEQGADAVASHYLRRILQERKNYRGGGRGYPKPLLVFIEEAHVLIPSNSNTLTKYWAARLAREGRKFGIGLALVSQRPKNVDADVLSQTNNKIILRMVEPQDIRYVQAASEELSDDLTTLLPSLNPGEAVVIGSMTRLPALVKIDECRERRGGGDIDLVAEWATPEEDVIEEVFQ